MHLIKANFFNYNKTTEKYFVTKFLEVKSAIIFSRWKQNLVLCSIKQQNTYSRCIGVYKRINSLNGRLLVDSSWS